ncbi:YoaK family protein [Pelagicoccus sp. SDUM812003]|uniref:YoaK family protein n=1 Tax=Pelagicoccus sp. SDUM812003 TaxID=3041267 RepID=UPI00280FCA38|nr:YoaK family protein [Pelagicoccus sp. SDUM812003]MDQ8202136.1 YoaK family protein [Pelagicoccus sp. SDUM812003]
MMVHEISPRHVLLGGCFLAFGAAFVNVGFILQTGASVSHLTGDLTRVAIELSSIDTAVGRSLARVGLATLGFIAGAFVSGYLLHASKLEMRKPYGRVISGIGLMLLLAFGLMDWSVEAAIGLSGVACGLQNALATRYRGSILRTTHVTGLLTDLGVMLGMRSRSRNIEGWRIGVPFFLSLSFFLGSLAGAFGSYHLQSHWLLVAGFGYLIGGMGWSLAKRLYFGIS